MEAREESFRQRVSALDMEVESKTQAAKRVETEAVEQMERMADSLKSLNTAFKALRADSTSVLTSCHCPSPSLFFSCSPGLIQAPCIPSPCRWHSSLLIVVLRRSQIRVTDLKMACGQLEARLDERSAEVDALSSKLTASEEGERVALLLSI
jgi:hypothetical protein